MGYGFRSEGRSGGGYGGDRQGGFRRPSPRAPVREGEEVDVVIESVGEKGDGIAKIKGFVIFVPNTRAEESVRIRIKKVLDKVGFGEVVGKIVEAKAMPKGSAESSDEVSALKADEPPASEDKLSKELENEDEVEEQADDEDEE